MSRPGRLSQYPFVCAHPQNWGRGRQGYQDVWFVIHCTDDDYADNYPAILGHYWATAPVKVSVHFCVSDLMTYQYVDMNDTAFQARNPGNLRGVGVELSGRKAWTRNQWLAHKRMLRRAAQLCAEVSAARGYRVSGPGLLRPADLRDRRSGITQHADLTAAFGGSHTDVGADFPWDFFWPEYFRAAATLAPVPATVPTDDSHPTEEDALMAVSEQEFTALVRKVDTLTAQVNALYAALISGQGNTWGSSHLRQQLGFVVTKVNAVAALVESVLGQGGAPVKTANTPATAPATGSGRAVE